MYSQPVSILADGMSIGLLATRFNVMPQGLGSVDVVLIYARDVLAPAVVMNEFIKRFTDVEEAVRNTITVTSRDGTVSRYTCCVISSFSERVYSQDWAVIRDLQGVAVIGE